jgi:threonine/homoserine/homoserine lactone efflux protein
MIFWQGFVTDVLNPKVGLFFLTLLPQFIDADASSKALAFLFLGLIFWTNGTLWNLFVAWSSARVAMMFRGAAGLHSWINRALGVVFIYLGMKLFVF